jgi:hypothetical protein
MTTFRQRLLRELGASLDLRCAWCHGTRGALAERWCSKRCRQSAWRHRGRVLEVERAKVPGHFVYADPPYVGLSSKYYRDEPTFAGEVDHTALIARLRDRTKLRGWALSCSAASLRELLPLCPPGIRVCPWVGVSGKTRGLHNAWEALLVAGGRQRPPGRRDWLLAMPARGEGKLPGRKPSAFCAFLFSALGMCPGDTIEELFPGTGIVGRSWASLAQARGTT